MEFHTLTPSGASPDVPLLGTLIARKTVERSSLRRFADDDLSTVFLALKGNERSVTNQLRELFEDLNLPEVRFRRPLRFIFFCGGQDQIIQKIQ